MRKFILLSLVVLITACTTPEPTVKQSQALDQVSSAPVTGMVVTANPYASKAGADILRAGGSAVDAAIAIEAVLSLVEPQSSGLGGGGFMLYYDNQSKALTVYDGRETAPAKVQHNMFLNETGESIGFLNAKNSGLATGVPGMVSMLSMAHQDHGLMKWGLHFARARELATAGFAISPRLHNFIVRFGKYIPSSIEEGPLQAHHYFFDQAGQPLPVGYLRTNVEYANTLDIIARDPRAFYRGAIADEIVRQVEQSPRAGYLSRADLENYSATKKQALCSDYQGLQLCGPPPASSWLAVGAIMGILQHAPKSSEQGALDPANWARFAEAQRLAYADRDHFVADSEFADVPVQGMLDPSYLKQRATLISPERAIDNIAPGNPWDYQAGEKVALGDDATLDFAGTTHFVVVDGEGNVVSMTASVESIFGTTRMAGGMFLNNQLTDFSFQHKDQDGELIANRIEPNKRPRSSMSPTIALDQNGDFLMATGSPGGNSIIAYTAKTLVGVLDWGLSAQQAVDLPNMVARGDKVRIEKDRADQSIIDGLRAYGYDVKESDGENSGLSVVVRNSNGILQGGVDPRREGVIEIVELR